MVCRRVKVDNSHSSQIEKNKCLNDIGVGFHIGFSQNVGHENKYCTHCHQKLHGEIKCMQCVKERGERE